MTRLPVLFSVLALLTGCATSITPEYDARFGDAVRAGRTAQTINPNAGSNPDPVAGMDGRSAREAILLYQGTFKSPPSVVNVINIGGPTGGQ